MPPPSYPPTALGDGVVLVEVLVGTGGEVRTARVVRSSGAGFNSSATRSTVRWRFQVGRNGPAPTLAYLIFGFRQPVVVVPRQ